MLDQPAQDTMEILVVVAMPTVETRVLEPVAAQSRFSAVAGGLCEL